MHPMMATEHQGESGARITLRAAGKSNARPLFNWLNAPDSLAGNLRTTGSIPWDVHRRWFVKRLADRGFGVSIVDLEGEPVGQRPMRATETNLKVDFYVVPKRRRQGLDREAPASAAAVVTRRSSGRRPFAQIRPENAASAAVFMATGYRLEGCAPDHLVYAFKPGSNSE